MITVTGTTGDPSDASNVKTDSADFKLTIKNPCIDPEYYEIEGKDSSTKQTVYVLGSVVTEPIVDYLSFDVNVKNPKVTQVCGAFTLFATFEGT